MPRKKVGQLIEAGLEKVDHITEQNLQAEHQRLSKTEAAELLGGILVVKTIGNVLAAQALRALQHFRDTQGWRAYGYESFADFLDHHPKSPMTKNQFYDREKLLEAEGDEAFDTLNSLKVPLSARKLLASGGMVSVEGDTLRIGQHDNEQVIALDDRTRIADAIKTLATKVEAQAKKIEMGEKKNTELKKAVDELKARPATGASSHPFDIALLNLIGSFTSLAIEAEKLSADELEQRRDNTLRQIANQRLRLEDAFGLAGPRRNGDSLGLSDSDLEELEAEM